MAHRLTTKLRHWTTQEHRFLELNYGVLPPLEVARQINRTVRAIETYARDHGISALDNRRAEGLLYEPAKKETRGYLDHMAIGQEYAR